MVVISGGRRKQIFEGQRRWQNDAQSQCSQCSNRIATSSLREGLARSSEEDMGLFSWFVKVSLSYEPFAFADPHPVFHARL